MNSVLVDALLLQCHDPCALVEILSWDSKCDSIPERETVDALHFAIKKVRSLQQQQEFEVGDKAGDNLTVKWIPFRKKLEDIVCSRCLPLLSKLCYTEEQNNGALSRNAGLMRALCDLISCCAELCGNDLTEKLAAVAVPVLLSSGDNESLEVTSHFDVDTAIEVIACAVPFLRPEQIHVVDKVQSAAVTCIKTGKDAVVSKVVVKLLFSLLNNNHLKKSSVIRIWESLNAWQAVDNSPGATTRILLCLTALSDYLLPSADTDATETIDLRVSEGFWELVQKGLTHRDNVSRKRALYLLKRSVAVSEEMKSAFQSCQSTDNAVSLFWWSPERNCLIVDFWEDYMLIMETLDETQIHLVMPVLHKINKLIEATISESQDCPLFHISWLICVYRRMFDSENKAVMKEGVLHLLSLHVMKYPVFSQGFAEFIVGPFVDILSESTLFNRSADQEIGSCPEISVKLQKFLVTFTSSLPEENKGRFLLQMVQNLANRHWCAVPILFISQALAQVKGCRAFGVEGLHALREVLRSTMITHQVLMRGAAQCYLLQTALNLTHVQMVTLEDVANFIQHFKTDESLSRGTLLWTQLCDWLHVNDSVFKPMEGVSVSQPGRPAVSVYVQHLVEAYMKVPAGEGNSCFMPDWFEAERVAKMVLLASDVEEIQGLESETHKPKQKGLEQLLYPLLDALRRLSTNVYLPVLKTDKSLQLLFKLLHISYTTSSPKSHDTVLTTLQDCILSTTDEVLEYILRRLTSELCLLSDLGRCCLYISVLRELVKLYSVVGWRRGSRFWSFIKSLTKNSLLNLQANRTEQDPQLVTQIQKVISMSSLAWVCEVASHNTDLQIVSTDAVKALINYISSAKLNQTLMKPAACEESQGPQDGATLQGWGRVAAQCVHDQWACLHFVLNKFAKLLPSSSDSQANGDLQNSLPAVSCPSMTLQCAVEALAILPSDQVLPVLSCMKILVPKIWRSDASLCVESMNLAWKVVKDLNSNPQDFWTTLEAFIQFVFDANLLRITVEDGCLIITKVKEMASKLIDMSHTKTGVFNTLMKHCCQTWMPSVCDVDGPVDDSFTSALNHIELFTEACVYGPVFRRDQRLIQDVHAFIQQLGEDCAANLAITSDNRDDQYPRVCAINFLCHLDPLNQLHKAFMEQLALRLLKKDEEVAKSKVRYYTNSLQHRVKNRLWQTLLVLLPKLEETFVVGILDKVYQAGFCNNQASVKYLIEWFLMLTLYCYPEQLHTFWDCFRYDQEKSKTSICTFLSVLTHFDILLENVIDKRTHLKKALDVILLWCFNHNFAVRLYALLALKKVWNVCRSACSEDVEFKVLAPVIEACLQQVEYMQGSGNAMKNWQRIQEHFFFGTFHPLKDYSIESIFYTFPSLSDLADDEWIPLWKFSELVEFPTNSSVSLNNPRKELGDLETGDWVQQDKGECENEAQWIDVQKKIIPWKNSIPDQDLELLYQERAARLGKFSNALIVVASLIDKPTNLGGLCRTCEIFGASALVVSGLHYINDKQFQSLSVSSEHWLPLVEVKPPQLINYLQQKTAEGYTIVGVEQTAKSQSLTEYTFPEKTLLLLGNEREGIPANLLQHLAVCVEIPQHGVTRSLNVHVSGALLIWEYTHQQMNRRRKTM
ncbi:putative methyltransferase TARBP1 [Huso huso]|uniref:Methyltransferase TARBP1 n=1 Tax=Huso huso TaxID=61971 RepID=A0ABR0ZX00_HUSHU